MHPAAFLYTLVVSSLSRCNITSAVSDVGGSQLGSGEKVLEADVAVSNNLYVKCNKRGSVRGIQTCGCIEDSNNYSDYPQHDFVAEFALSAVTALSAGGGSRKGVGIIAKNS